MHIRERQTQNFAARGMKARQAGIVIRAPEPVFCISSVIFL